MKKLIGTVVLGISLTLTTLSVASADSVQQFSLTQSVADLDGYTSPEGVTFTKTAGPDRIAAFVTGVSGSGYLNFKGALNTPIRFELTRDGAPLVAESGKILTPAARVTTSSPTTMYFGRGDFWTLAQTGPTYCGESFQKVNAYDNSYALTYGPQISTLEMNGVLLKTCVLDRSAFALTQFSMYTAGDSQFVNLTLYAETIVAPAPEPTPEPTPSPEPEPEPISTDPMLIEMDKLRETITEQRSFMDEQFDAIRATTDGNATLIDTIDADARARDAAEEAARIAQDEVIEEKLSLLDKALKLLDNIIHNIPFINRGSK